MDLPIYQIDAFTDRVFGGNPAAVCPLESWLPDPVLQAIAAENNLSETAFIVPDGDGYALRWFTPTVEVELCGHASLAAGYLVLTRLAPGPGPVRFKTVHAGVLEVSSEGGLFALDLPSDPCVPFDCPDDLAAGLRRRPAEILRGRNYLAVFESESDIRAFDPDLAALARLHPYGVIVTAPGDDCDFVSRFFAPSFGVPEDPVTGSAHGALTPYWAGRLGRTRLDARQISTRGGVLTCEHLGERTRLGGQAALYLEGRIWLPD